jgi:aminoglycoside phosphotransferase (APT) family kinase protein
MADELHILRGCLQAVAEASPAWAPRLEPLFDACAGLGAAVPPAPPRGIHRDFYADQVIVDGPRLSLIDFDLYCAGDPGLDAGNFLGHITEQSLRTRGDPAALADREEALEERFVELSGEGTRPAVRAYAALTLARHVYLSTRLPDRRPWTASLLELCEERLGVVTGPSR